MTDSGADTAARIGPIVDSNVHLWDQSRNPTFWLSDRGLLVGMLGNYDSLPDRYTVADYRADTSGFDVRGVVWSDPGTADPIAAIDQVHEQDRQQLVAGIVTLGDPLSAGFPELVERIGRDRSVTSVRVRLVRSLHGDQGRERSASAMVERLRQLATAGMVATIEAESDQLPRITELAGQLPGLRIVVDHFGWPTDLSHQGRRVHFARLEDLARRPNVATRVDAIGTVFGDWDTATIAPWLHGVLDIFGADRCMLGSDMPIERLRSDFSTLYAAYDQIFRACSDEQRAELFAESATAWLGAPRTDA